MTCLIIKKLQLIMYQPKGVQTSSVTTSGELVKNANSQAHQELHNQKLRGKAQQSVLTSSPGDSDAH